MTSSYRAAQRLREVAGHLTDEEAADYLGGQEATRCEAELLLGDVLRLLARMTLEAERAQDLAFHDELGAAGDYTMRALRMPSAMVSGCRPSTT